MTDSAGNTFTFYGFSDSIPTTQQGQFASSRDAGGNMAVAQWNEAGQMTEVDLTPYLADSPVATYAYAYGADSYNPNKVSTVTISQLVSGTMTPVQQVDYTYYDGTYSGDDTYGNLGNLKLVQVENYVGSGAYQVVNTTYFRYYTPADDGSVGYTGGLQYEFTNASYSRLTASFTDPFAASITGADVGPYADIYAQYNGSGQITALDQQGSGCSVCDGGLGEYTYSYTDNRANGGVSTDFNAWVVRTIETLPDGSTNTVYSNFAGETMLADHTDAATGQDSITYYRYDSAGRLVLTANPSVFGKRPAGAILLAVVA